MVADFTSSLSALCHTKNTHLGIILAPHMLVLPHFIQRYDDPFLPYGKAIINATHALTCIYMFDLAAYLTLGAAGAIALERTLRYAEGEGITVVHGPFASLHYASILEETGFGAHAVTITQDIAPDTFLKRSDRGVFVFQAGDSPQVTLSSNAGVYNPKDQTLRISEGTAEIRIHLIVDRELFSRASEDFQGEIQANMEKLRAQYAV